MVDPPLKIPTWRLGWLAIWVLIACIYVQSLCHVQLFDTPRTVVSQAPLSMGLSWQEYCNGLPFSPPWDLPDPGSEPESPLAPALAGRFCTRVTWQALESWLEAFIYCKGRETSLSRSPAPWIVKVYGTLLYYHYRFHAAHTLVKC